MSFSNGASTSVTYHGDEHPAEAHTQAVAGGRLATKNGRACTLIRYVLALLVPEDIIVSRAESDQMISRINLAFAVI